MTKAPLGRAGTGANPTDRGKKGTKRSILTDGKGIPLSVTSVWIKDMIFLISENWLKNMVILPISKAIERKT